MAAPMKMSCLRSTRYFSAKFGFNLNFRHSTRVHSKASSTSAPQDASLSTRDPGPAFLKPEVQRILYKVTGFNLDKIFENRPIKDIAAPAYKLMTDRQLQEAQEEAIELGKERLQMPPFMKAREQDTWELISDDAEISGHDIVKHVFTDITFGVPERDRVMVVREPNGVLRTATWSERDRIQKIYSPSEGQMHRIPQMFHAESLEKLLVEGQYEYILDRACVQFDPDDPEFLRVTHRTYEHIDETGHYEDLYSTRHFGGMTFYLIFYKKPDNLIMHKLQHNQISDAGDLVRLFILVHPDSATAKSVSETAVSDNIDLIKTFIAKDSSMSSQLELALQSYLSSHK